MFAMSKLRKHIVNCQVSRYIVHDVMILNETLYFIVLRKRVREAVSEDFLQSTKYQGTLYTMS